MCSTIASFLQLKLNLQKAGFMVCYSLLQCSDIHCVFGLGFSQVIYTCWNMGKNTRSLCHLRMPARSSPCPGWSWEERLTWTAPRQATVQPLPSRPSLSMGASCIGQWHKVTLRFNWLYCQSALRCTVCRQLRDKSERIKALCLNCGKM